MHILHVANILGYFLYVDNLVLRYELSDDEDEEIKPFQTQDFAEGEVYTDGP